MSEPTPPTQVEYSRAFENLVGDDNDLVGLLAYALFKQSVREAVQQGQTSPFSRNPPASVVNTYRLSATRRLEQFAASVVDDQKIELLDSTTVEAVRNAASDIKVHVSQRTNFGSALLTNIIAWLVTLAITVAVIWLSGRASPEDVIVGAAQKADEARSALHAHGQARGTNPAAPAQ